MDENVKTTSKRIIKLTACNKNNFMNQNLGCISFLFFLLAFSNNIKAQLVTNAPIVSPDRLQGGHYFFPNGPDQGLYAYRFNNDADKKENALNNVHSVTLREFFKTVDLNKFDGDIEKGKRIGNLFINKNSADAEKGDEVKMMYMALTYRVYLKDLENEIVWLDKLVEKGNDYAMMRRGDLYEDEININKSVYLYNKLVSKGNSVAMVGLAEIYILHFRQDIITPVTLLNAAINKNNTEAFIDLANLYSGEYGTQYPQDYKKAMELYLQALKINEEVKYNKEVMIQRRTIMEHIAMLHKNGNGVDKSNAEYRKWMKMSKHQVTII